MTKGAGNDKFIIDMIPKKVRRTIDKYGMIKKGDSILVAFSGGPDSLVLLDVLFSLRKELGISLYLGHLNHLMRGKEAQGDVLYAKKIARKYNLPITVGRRNVPALIKRKKFSPEEGAREARYAFLEKTAQRVGANKIAIGSTADDQAETVLMKFLRGAGLKGLGGIAPLRFLDANISLRKKSSICVIRPLLEVTRGEIEVYLKKKHFAPRLDASNLELLYLRNRIRKKLIPYLARNYNPKIKSLLAGMARILQADEEYLSFSSDKAFQEIAKVQNNGEIYINIRQLKSQHISLERRILRKSIQLVKGDLKSITLVQLDNILDLAEGLSGREIHLPRKLIVRRLHGNLVISKKKKKDKRVSEPLSSGRLVKLPVPGRAEIKKLNLKIDASLLSGSKFKLDKKKLQHQKNVVFFDFHKIKLPLIIRYRREGDCFRPLGMQGEKKLKNFFIDQKISREERGNIPLLFQGDELLWIIGYRQGDIAKITDETKKVLCVKVKKLRG